MPTARPTQDKKRQRASATALSSDDDSDCDRLNTDSRPCQAERKRELERNRRNLINVRFSELDCELRRSAPPLDPTSASLTEAAAASKVKRIDKEAVLKEATQRIALQRKEVAAAMERAASMMAEIDNLRAEKVELRGDKAYLRSELDTVRRDVQRLRSDNLNLWQAVHKSSSIKNQLTSNLVKLPSDLFSRSKLGIADPPASPAAAAANAPTCSMTAAAIAASVALPTAAQTLSTAMPDPHDPIAMLAADNPYLIYQSSEDIGDLFATYVPGSATPVVPPDPRPPSNPTAPENVQPVASMQIPAVSQPIASRACATQTRLQPQLVLLPSPTTALAAAAAQTPQLPQPGGMDPALHASLGLPLPMMSPPMQHSQFARGSALAASLWFADARDNESEGGGPEALSSGAQADSGKVEATDLLSDIAPCV